MSDDEEYWDIVSVEKIAEVYQIPLLADMIEMNKKLDVNMNHVSGFYEGDGQGFHFMPIVQFHPMEKDEGFKIIIFNHADENGNSIADVLSFYKSEEEPGNYKIFLHENGDILSEEVIIPFSGFDVHDELETYPSSSVSGYEDPFKMLDKNPILDI